MKFHDELNPKLWNNFELKEEVKDKLEEIAQAFIDYLNIPDEAILDIRITGSSANYNYTKHSDLDLHLIVDYEQVHKECPIVEGYLWSMKSAFNKEHDISIYGIDVEVYAEDSRQQAISNGVYSLLDDEWIKKPEKIEPTNNDAAVLAKYNEIKDAVEKLNDSEEAELLLDKIYEMRKAGLTEQGEFSTENLAFKMLRNEGIIDRLKDIKKKNIDKQLTLESYNKSTLFNDNFWKWFGNSKVIDKEGDPLVVYHGSPKNDIEVFDTSRGTNIKGIYFSNNLNVAAHWSGNSSMKRKKNIPNANTVEELLQILNTYTEATIEYVDFDDGRFYRLETYGGDMSSPIGYKKDENTYVLRGREYDLRNRLREEIRQFSDYAANSGNYGCYLSIQNPLMVNANKKPYYKIKFNGSTVTTEELVNFAQKSGYDGVIVKNVYETDYENILCDDYIVFDSNQIKSTENNGRWSKRSNNIYEVVNDINLLGIKNLRYKLQQVINECL